MGQNALGPQGLGASQPLIFLPPSLLEGIALSFAPRQHKSIGPHGTS